MSIFSKVKSVAKKGKDKVVKYSPEILVGLGIIGFGITVYQSCKATIKVKGIMEEYHELDHKADVSINAGAMNSDGTLYSASDYEADKKNLKYQTGWKVAKVLIVPVSMFAASTLCELAGFHIIKKRYAGMVLAYNSLKSSYDYLYSNVAKEYGEDKAFELANGVKKIGEDENGNAVYQKVDDNLTAMPYAVYITPNNCKYWERNEWENDFQLQNIERNGNELRECDGYLLYHSILKDIGYKPQSEEEKNILPISCRVGWVFDEKRIAQAKADGLNPDGFVDLRITKLYYDDEYEKARELCDEDRDAGEAEFDRLDKLFFNNRTGQYVNYIYMINPNIDGEIYQYI